MTNVIRSLVLEALGYKVRVTELVGWEHAMKNEIVVATKVQGQNSAARKALVNLLRDTSPGFDFSNPPLYLFRGLMELGIKFDS